MKRIQSFFIMVLVALMAFTCFASCGTGGPGAATTLSITFDYNYDGAPAATVVTVEKGEKVTLPADPTRDGYAFDGWHTDKACTSDADFGRGATADVTYYAAWNQTDITVSFDLNYEGAPALEAQTIAIGGTATEPAAPTREGFLFQGWYADAAGETAFDFTAELRTETTVYAKWEEIKLDDGEKLVTITFMYNYEGAPNNGVATTRQQAPNRIFPNNVSAQREGHYLKGWYNDAECTSPVVIGVSNRLTEDTTVYARWYSIYKFEAEDIDVSELSGNGYSGDANGKSMIQTDDVKGASNGRFIGYLYKTGATLTFKVNASEAINGAVIALRLSAEFGDKTITQDSFTVKVNGNKVTYASISFVGVPDGSDIQDYPFRDYTLNTNVNLVAGENIITLEVSNSERGEGGTMEATAPQVDCLYLYADVDLAWAEGYPKDNYYKG